jgi:hypothetical protein
MPFAHAFGVPAEELILPALSCGGAALLALRTHVGRIRTRAVCALQRRRNP